MEGKSRQASIRSRFDIHANDKTLALDEASHPTTTPRADQAGLTHSLTRMRMTRQMLDRITSISYSYWLLNDLANRIS